MTMNVRPQLDSGGRVRRESMRRSNWVWLAGAFVAIPAVVAAIAFVDASFELGMLHSTWQTAAVIFGAVAIGVYLLWRLELRARWQQIVLVLAYAPAMLAFLAWLGLVIQFTFDDCMAQQAVSMHFVRVLCAALGMHA